MGVKRARDATSDAESFESDAASERVEAGKRKVVETVKDKSLRQKQIRKEDEEKEVAEKNKMIKIKGEWAYEEDLTEKDRDFLKTTEDRYKPGHVGFKIVEATLNPSARSGNNEANKLKIIRYVHEKKFRVESVKMMGFGKVELTFNDYRDANRCLADNNSGEQNRIIDFYITKRAKICKRVVSGWDINAYLDELAENLIYPNNIIEIEE